MTTPAPEKVRKVTDPAIVLGQIENSHGPVGATSEPQPTSGPPRLRVVHADGEVFDDHLDQPFEVPPQIAELTGHLKRRRDQLQEKEAKLNEKIASWQQSIDQRSAASSDRERKLKNREQHLRSLQFHLLQMQNDIVDSQLSMEGVIEHFENTDSDEYMKLALEMLRFEVLERFDYISKRWEMLHDKLENLYDEQPQRKVA
jgi:chromosome segregation ATPase